MTTVGLPSCGSTTEHSTASSASSMKRPLGASASYSWCWRVSVNVRAFLAHHLDGHTAPTQEYGAQVIPPGRPSRSVTDTKVLPHGQPDPVTDEDCIDCKRDRQERLKVSETEHKDGDHYDTNHCVADSNRTIGVTKHVELHPG